MIPLTMKQLETAKKIVVSVDGERKIFKYRFGSEEISFEELVRAAIDKKKIEVVEIV